MMTKHLTILLVLVAMASAVPTVDTHIQTWGSNAVYHSINATAACTTDLFQMENMPEQAVWFNLYTSAYGSDSAVVVISYQVSDVKNHWPKTWTSLGTFYSDLVDSMRTASQRFGYQYYPLVSRYVRFKAEGAATNAATTFIDSLIISGYHD